MTGKLTRLMLSKKCQGYWLTRSINRWLTNVNGKNITRMTKNRKMETTRLPRLRQREHCYQPSVKTAFCWIQQIKSKKLPIWRSSMKVGKNSRSSKRAEVKSPWCLLSTSKTINTSWTTGLVGYSSETATLTTILLPTWSTPMVI